MQAVHIVARNGGSQRSTAQYTTTDPLARLKTCDKLVAAPLADEPEKTIVDAVGLDLQRSCQNPKCRVCRVAPHTVRAKQGAAPVTQCLPETGQNAANQEAKNTDRGAASSLTQRHSQQPPVVQHA